MATKKSVPPLFVKLCQIIYLTVTAFFRNNLAAVADACSFGFIFSFFPILLMILTTFISVLHISPAVAETIIEKLNGYTKVFDAKQVIESIGQGVSASFVNIVLSIFVILMARKLLLSIMKAFLRIFKTVSPRRPVINQLFAFAGILLIVFICTVVFFAAFVTKQIFELPVFENVSEAVPFLFGTTSNLITNGTLYFFIFIFTAIAYKFAPGTRPRPKTSICLLFSALCTLLFFAFFTIFSAVINHAKYNTIYGLVSNVIILLFEIHIFFYLFLMFAEGIYTIQFMDISLLAELYLLPDGDNLTVKNYFRRLLFITPTAIMNEKNTAFFDKNDIVYEKNDEPKYIYYVASGSVLAASDEKQVFCKKGDFFGEIEYLLEVPRKSTVTAQEKCVLVKITQDEFTLLMRKSPKVAGKVLSKLTKQFKETVL